jgi:alkylated DNA repair dioxygenase AlkB
MLKPLVLPSDGTPIDFPGARLRYFESFFTEKEAKAHFNQLLEETPWQQDPITVFGKTYAQPRLTALYANNSLPYSYSGITMHPTQMTPLLSQIQERIHQVCSYPIYYCTSKPTTEMEKTVTAGMQTTKKN